MDHGGQLQEDVLGESVLLGPIGDVGAQDQVDRRVGLPKAVVEMLLVDLLVEVVLVRRVLIIHVGGGSNDTPVARGGGNGTGVHESHARELALTGLGALAVGEVSRGVTEGEAVVGGDVAGTEAGTAEGGLDDSARRQQVSRYADLGQLQRNGNRGRIDRQGEVAVSGIVVAENGGGLVDGVEHTTGATGDDALVSQHGAVSLYLVHQVELGFFEFRGGLSLHRCQNLLGVGHEIVDGVDVGGMEGKGDHGLHLREIDVDHGVVVSYVGGSQLLVVLGTAMNLEMLSGNLVSEPDGGQAGGLGGHNVDTVTEVNG